MQNGMEQTRMPGTAGEPAELKNTEIWEKYQKGCDHHRNVGLYRTTEQCHWMYEGDQWHGLKSGGESFPVQNFIKPVVRYKVANVAMNTTAIVFNAVEGGGQMVSLVCERLNRVAESVWEMLKMESRKWTMVKNCAIEGDYYAYLYDDTRRNSESVVQAPFRLGMRLISRTNVYLEDEQNGSLDEQGYIIIAERQTVDAVRRRARECGIPEEQVAQIVSDEVDDTRINTTSAEEVRTKNGKCTVLLYMEKTPEGLKFCRSTKSVVFEQEQLVAGLDSYPLTRMVWEEKSGSARGIGCVEPMVPNQLIVNKNLARRDLVTKRLGFPNLVYDEQLVDNPNDLGKAGAQLRMRNLAKTPLRDVIGYLTPPQMNGDAAVLQQELMEKTRELEGASSDVTGQVDPTKTSGEAIKAARDQSAMNLNEQAAAYKQWIEDWAKAVYKLYLAYLPGGMTVQVARQGRTMLGGEPAETSVPVVIPQKDLLQMELNVRIDVSNTDPYSVLSRELALENALAAQHITFEEYVQAMDGNAGVPKDKFEEILRMRREAQQAMQAAQRMMAQPAGMPGMVTAGMPMGQAVRR